VNRPANRWEFLFGYVAELVNMMSKSSFVVVSKTVLIDAELLASPSRGPMKEVA